MKVIGIDASSNKTGISVFEDGKYITHTIIDCHKIEDVYQRIPIMVSRICGYIDLFSGVSRIVMEESILKTNIQTVKKLAYIMGGVMSYAYRRKIEFKSVLPSEWRRKVGLEQSNKIKRSVLKEEAVAAVAQEYEMQLTDDEAESILIARSEYELPKIKIKVENTIENWN